MTPAALSAVLLLATLPAAALSAPSCPGPDLSVPPPGATAVELRHADVPDARFPGWWQQGRLGDLVYRLYAGGFGTIGAGPHMEAWRIEISCNPRDRTCTYRDFGEVPEGMQPRARQLGTCLLGPAPRPAPPAPTPAADTAAAPPAPVPPAPPEPQAAAEPAASPPPPPAAPPSAGPQALTREPAPAAPRAPADAAPDRAEAPARSGSLAREPAPVAAAPAPRPDRPAAAPESAAPGPGALVREPAPAAPIAAAPAAPAPPERAAAPAAPSAAPRVLTREPVPAAPRGPAAPARTLPEPAPDSADPTAYLCWPVPRLDDPGASAAEAATAPDLLVCRLAPAPAEAVPEAPSTPAPPPAPAAVQPESSPVAPPAASDAAPVPGGASGSTSGPRRPADPPIPPASVPAEASDGDPTDGDEERAGSGEGDPPAPPPDPPPAPPEDGAATRPQGQAVAGSLSMLSLDGLDRINLLSLAPTSSAPPRAGDRRPPPAPASAATARPLAAARLRTGPPRARRTSPPPPAPAARAATAPLALTRCTLGSAIALGREDIAEIGQISVNLGCSGRIGNRLTFSGGLTVHPVPGSRHGGDLAYSYALNWRATDRVTLTYANYAAALAGGRALAGLGEGRLQISAPVARFPLGTRSMPDRAMTCTGFVSLARGASSNGGVNCGLGLTPRLSLRFTALAYPPGTQNRNDADFSYSASYALNDRVMLTYSNYGNNRWPWNRSPDQIEPFHGGTLGLSYRWDF